MCHKSGATPINGTPKVHRKGCLFTMEMSLGGLHCGFVLYVVATILGAIIGLVLPCGIQCIAAVLGFATGGITRGSRAASMMSYSAIAEGGGVSSGSTVAICQSIGATGTRVLCFAGVGAAIGAIGSVVACNY